VKKPSAIAGSALFFLVAPGIVAVLAPWLIVRWDRSVAFDPAVQIPGGLVVLAGIAFLLHAFAKFALEGAGTPAPVAPTERLVVGGIYRHVRNPMYLAVIAIIVGQALAFSNVAVLVYAAIAAATMFGFVKLYEEPTLAERYGRQYEEYRANVPGWWPRLSAWRGS
jgi:protein-S-isoprenylcysteine O-methyltransferase Ste14